MTVRDRYQVCDPCCGLVDAYQTALEAMNAARFHVRDGCTGVSVYDLMAHRGSPQEWTANGQILRRREAIA